MTNMSQESPATQDVNPDDILKSDGDVARFALDELRKAMRAEQAAEQRANTDVLTGLPNRRALEKRLEEISEASADGEYGVLFIDGDNFKRINDELGHTRGDQVLLDTGNVLRRAVRASEEGRDEVFRRGGDEFVVLVYLGPQGNTRRTDQPATPEQLGRVGERVYGELAALLAKEENADIKDYYGLSIGTAWPDGNSTPDAMVETAETEMRGAKQANHATNGHYR